MRVVTLARRPCREVVLTNNVVRHHAGALNIDATRLGAGDGGLREAEASRERRYPKRGGRDFHLRPGVRGDSRGRWPANVVLVHDHACEFQGVVEVGGYVINRWQDGAKPFGGGAGTPYEGFQMPTQEVEIWACRDRCVAHRMDLQSGTQATSFFKQVKSMDDVIPVDLVEYLFVLASPPPDVQPVIIAELDLSAVDFSRYGDETVHGLVTSGDPTPWLEQIHRVLLPGAHVLLISDEKDSTGATGACAIEDFGYEIRDAIVVLQGDDEFTYSAKPSSRERHEGVAPRDRITKEMRLFPKEGEDARDLREELAEVLDDEVLERMDVDGLPPDDVPDEIKESFDLREVEFRRELRNDHPTIKSVGLMASLLRGTPAGALVVDPFMGSGTTGIACLREGYDFVGIEQERDSLTISDQRIRHWDRKEFAWDGATIESEALPFEHESEPLGEIFDLMGED